ncbi:type A chloramphenicol O-acetyltransferase [Wohlfahrtiimonas populi]|uniref:type A chloramphenicol O-acetyltransferase n=1 Tax=Wohlfahrtiimonas populi TaxID=1940240 RepID=UPI00098D6F5F|nr:type A chloramphenicol O-acetyltransferase [Wohlfahrtiimonas populi]
MQYQIIDLASWNRQEHYNFYRQIQCNFSLTTEIDVTNVVAFYKHYHYKFYPVMIYLITQAVNQVPALKMALKNEQLIEWETVLPSYTIFHPESETFSSLWTEYHSDLTEFMRAYEEDFAEYQYNLALSPKPNLPENHFNISSLPWMSFSGFNLGFSEVNDHFAPIFTMEKFSEKDGKLLLPLAIQVHHAVCDGFHIGRFIDLLHECIDELIY